MMQLKLSSSCGGLYERGGGAYYSRGGGAYYSGEGAQNLPCVLPLKNALWP